MVMGHRGVNREGHKEVGMRFWRIGRGGREGCKEDCVPRIHVCMNTCVCPIRYINLECVLELCGCVGMCIYLCICLCV